MVKRYFLISVLSGLLFGVMDGAINANPLASRLFEVYQPISRSELNIQAGILIDLLYGFALAGLYLLLYKSLPGSGWVKGFSYGLIVWFLRVAMGAAPQWMMFNLPLETLGYSLLTGLVEMLVLGLFFGLTLKPASKYDLPIPVGGEILDPSLDPFCVDQEKKNELPKRANRRI